MAKKLELSDDQTAKLKSTMESEKEAVTPLREKQHELIKKLKGQVKDKVADADIQTTLNDLKSNPQAIRDQMEKFQSQKETLLTPTQRAKMILGRNKKMHRGKHHEEHEE